MAKSDTLLIKAGAVVLGQTVSRQDILVDGEKIAAVGDLSGIKADRELDAADLLVLPGAVDTHVHFNDEFMNTVSVHDFEAGTKAAAYGGVTSVVDFANQKPGGSLHDALKGKKIEAEGNALVDWGVHPVITQLSQETLGEIPRLVQEGAPTIKCYMTYREEGLMMEYRDLLHILQRLKECNGMLMLHAEDNEIIETNIPKMIKAGQTQAIYHAKSRPVEAEDRAIQLCIKLARETGGRVFIVHLSSGSGMEAISAAKAKGLDIMAETCSHYLFFTEKMLERADGIKWICSPPLRDAATQARLWEGTQDGRIAMVTSDDSAFSWEAKLFGGNRFDKCPNGIPGIEPRLNLLYSEGVVKGRFSLPRLVELVATTPAVLFGLAPQKGTLFPGTDADIVLLDPQEQWTMNQESLHMATDWSAYEDVKITGKIVKVFARGELIIDHDECLAKKGRGKYLHRKLNPQVRPTI